MDIYGTIYGNIDACNTQLECNQHPNIPFFATSQKSKLNAKPKTGQYLGNELSIIDHYKLIGVSEFDLYILQMEWQEKVFTSVGEYGSFAVSVTHSINENELLLF